MIEIHRYTAAYHRDWNDFVSESSNGTFLFLREYMEYHVDRFTDYSLLVYDGNKLLALLPANRSGDVLYSHAGLTYGGLVVTTRNNTAQIWRFCSTLLTFFGKMVLSSGCTSVCPTFIIAIRRRAIYMRYSG